MTWRSTTALITVLAALVLVLWWNDRPPGIRPAPSAAPLLAPGDVPTIVEIQTADVTHRFERADGRWRTANAGGDPDAVPALLDALRTLAPLLVVDAAPATPADFGLGPDAVRLVASSEQAVMLDLDVGTRNPARTGVYVRHHGTAPIAMTGALLAWELGKVMAPIATGNALTKRHETREPSGSRPAKEAP